VIVGLRPLRRRLAGLALLAVACGAAAQNAPAADYAQRYATVCAACHGAQGISSTANTPSLAGQPSFYAITQLFLFRDGRRDSGPMTAIAKDMSDDDLRGFSTLIGGLPAAPAALGSKPDTAPDAAPDAARMARGAAAARRLHCLSCHGSAGEGSQQVPRVAGQREDYLRIALRGFRGGTRVGYGPAMTEAIAGVTPADIDDLAHFLAHWPAALAAAGAASQP
jgi:cytochrome c553